MNKLRVATYFGVNTNHVKHESSLETHTYHYEKLAYDVT